MAKKQKPEQMLLRVIRVAQILVEAQSRQEQTKGEFHALLARQEVGDWIYPLSPGSATSRLTTRWYAELSSCHTILVACDNDESGENGADNLLNISPRFRRLTVPFGKDITDLYLLGGNITAWITGAMPFINKNSVINESC